MTPLPLMPCSPAKAAFTCAGVARGLKPVCVRACVLEETTRIRRLNQHCANLPLSQPSLSICIPPRVFACTYRNNRSYPQKQQDSRGRSQRSMGARSKNRPRLGPAKTCCRAALCVCVCACMSVWCSSGNISSSSSRGSEETALARSISSRAFSNDVGYSRSLCKHVSRPRFSQVHSNTSISLHLPPTLSGGPLFSSPSTPTTLTHRRQLHQSASPHPPTQRPAPPRAYRPAVCRTPPSKSEP